MTPAILPVMPMSTEALYEAANVLEQKTDASTASLTVFQGTHPEHGPVTVVISPFGDGFIVQAASSA